MIFFWPLSFFPSLFCSLEETREELEEFQSGSRELEAELEAQLEQTENRCSEYQSQLNRLAIENDSLKVQSRSVANSGEIALCTFSWGGGGRLQ